MAPSCFFSSPQVLEIGWGDGGWAEMQFAGRLVEVFVFGDLLGKVVDAWTYPLKNDPWKRRSLLETIIFWCYRESIPRCDGCIQYMIPSSVANL